VQKRILQYRNIRATLKSCLNFNQHQNYDVAHVICGN